MAQEFQSVFTGYDRAAGKPGPPSFTFAKADRRVTVYYFYVLDRDFGPGFIKLCSYFPYPAKMWVDAAGGRMDLSGTIAGGAVIQVTVGQAVQLGNQGDAVVLVDATGASIDQVTYRADRVRPGRTICFGR